MDTSYEKLLLSTEKAILVDTSYEKLLLSTEKDILVDTSYEKSGLLIGHLYKLESPLKFTFCQGLFFPFIVQVHGNANCYNSQ